MVETLGTRRSPAGGRKRNIRSPSPVPSPRPPKSTPAPPTQVNNHTTTKNHVLKVEEEVMQTNEHKQLPASKEVKSTKVETSSRDGVNNEIAVDTEQGRKVKPVSTNAKSMATNSTKTVANNVNDLRTLAVKNNLQRRKRERTPSPTPSSVPGAKRHTNNTPTSQLTVNDTTGQPSNPKTVQQQQPAVKPLSGAVNNALKLSSVARLVKPEISSASKVLTEEIQKQQGQENTRLKILIFKEVKKQGKSKLSSLFVCVCDFTLITPPPLSSLSTPLYRLFSSDIIPVFRRCQRFSRGTTWICPRNHQRSCQV